MSEGPKIWTILAVLDWTRAHFESRGLESPRLDAEVLIADALHLPRVMLYAKFDQPLSDEERATIRARVGRRARGEPIAYIIGEREFFSLAFEVTPEVLIPRPETEGLVEAALRLLKDRPEPWVADVGTGSGAIAVTIATEVPPARVFALDRSRGALEVARRNAARHQVDSRVTTVESDLLDALPRAAPDQAFDLICANLPYIPSAVISTLARDVREHEPLAALDGGPDGLDLIRRLIVSAPPRIKPGGAILLEIGYDQGKSVTELLLSAGWQDARVHPDLAGKDRVVEATWRTSGPAC